ncbi:hypothetical protein CAEBREN_30681 [Caenorhabditis brenneri]|uniref:Uncharacterized protein n=1 Tax=Caenorhabditis brenneri TaxID=135651 RepID=G0PK58_CAEBE|nr:hypothetical protein CAEBREN_30681 [Caenorhabditis brenneri]
MDSHQQATPVEIVDQARANLTAIIGSLTVMERTFAGQSLEPWIKDTKHSLVETIVGLQRARTLLDDDQVLVVDRSPPGSLSVGDKSRKRSPRDRQHHNPNSRETSRSSSRKRASLSYRVEHFMEEVDRRSSNRSTDSNRLASEVCRAARPKITTRVLVSDSVVAKGNVKCVFCKKRHYSDQCSTHHKVEERREIASSQGICTLCFKKGSHKCTRRSVCKYCHQVGHAEAFCMNVKKTVMEITHREVEPLSTTPSPEHSEPRSMELRSDHRDEDDSESEKDAGRDEQEEEDEDEDTEL